MSFRRENEIDLDQLAAFLQNAVEKVKTEENPDLDYIIPKDSDEEQTEVLSISDSSDTGSN